MVYLSELLRFYKNIDIQTDAPMSSDYQISLYHKYLIEKDAIRCVVENDRLLGYVSYYRINFEQLGRLVCQLPFNAMQENITDGNICYLIDVTIDPEFRKGSVYKKLKKMFFEKNFDCDHFIGHAIYKKRSQPIRVFKKTEFMKRYAKELV